VTPYIQEMAQQMPVRVACAALALPRSQYYRQQQPPQAPTAGTPVEKAAGKPHPRALSAAETATVHENCSPVRGFRTCRPTKCMGRCWMKRGGISARSAPCTGFCSGTGKRRRAAGSGRGLPIRNRNCWLPRRTRSGRGTLPNCAGRGNGPTTISM